MTRGKLLRLEWMIPAYGIIVKHIFPYACLFRNFVQGELENCSYLQFSGREFHFLAENCNFLGHATIGSRECAL